MEHVRHFAVVGADARQRAAGRALRGMGFRVSGPERLAEADYILLPLPLGEDSAALTELLRAAKPGALALGGRISPEAQAIARRAGIPLLDYFAREELAILNAVPTAEGCLEILLRQTPRTLWQERVLLTGFGHVGQALAGRLHALGARVTVAARSPAQRAAARTGGLASVPLTRLAEAAEGCPVAVNTVPALLFTDPVLAALPRGALLVDLASRPGGTDFGAAERLGVCALHALSLPTACAPESAGRAVAQTVCRMAEEWEEALQ